MERKGGCLVVVPSSSWPSRWGKGGRGDFFVSSPPPPLQPSRGPPKKKTVRHRASVTLLSSSFFLSVVFFMQLMCLSLTFSSSFLLFWAVREKSTSEAEIRPLPLSFAVASIFELFFRGRRGGKGRWMIAANAQDPLRTSKQSTFTSCAAIKQKGRMLLLLPSGASSCNILRPSRGCY